MTPLADHHCFEVQTTIYSAETTTLMEIRIAVFGSDQFLKTFNIHSIQKGSEATGIGRIVGNKGGYVHDKKGQITGSIFLVVLS